MTPNELAQYPYATQIAITHIADKIIKTQRHQINTFSKESDKISFMVVMNNGPYQIRSVVDNTSLKGQLIILKNFRPYESFNRSQYQKCALRFIELVQEYEDSKFRRNQALTLTN